MNDNIISLFNNIADFLDEINDEALTETTLSVIKDYLTENVAELLKDDKQKAGILMRNLTNSDKEIMIENTKKSLYEELENKSFTNPYKKELVIFLIDLVINYLSITDDNNLQTPIIYFQKLVPSAKLPVFAHEGDACADISAAYHVIIPAHSLSNKISTGLCAAIPEGWEVQIRARSGLSLKTGLRISNGIGTIDSSYLGEWCVLLDNFSNEDISIEPGDRIAQISFKPTYNFIATEIESIKNIKDTDRGEGGFGSSGK